MGKKERKTITISEEAMDAVYESMDYLSCSFSQAVEYAVCIAASVHRGCTVAGMTKDDVFIGAGPPPTSREGTSWIARELGDVPMRERDAFEQGQAIVQRGWERGHAGAGVTLRD